MEEIEEPKTEHKVLVGFKCAPSLRAILCNQADKLGVSLSSYMETLVLNQEETNKKLKILTEQNKSLTDRISFYENPFLKDLFEQYKDKSITVRKYKDNIFTIYRDFRNPEKRQAVLQYNREDVLNLRALKELIFEHYPISNKDLLKMRLT